MTDTTREDELLRIILEQDDRLKLDVAELATLRDQAESREEDVRSLNDIVARLDAENATLRKAIEDRRAVEGWVNDSDEDRYCQLIRDAQAGTFTIALTDLGMLDLVDCPDGEGGSRTQYEFDFTGQTPDEAFFAAAEWARGQS